MSLSSALSKPQVFDESTNSNADELQLIAELINVFIQKPELGKIIGERLVSVLTRELNSFLILRQERSRMAFGKVRNLLSSFERNITELIDRLDDDLLAAIPVIVEIILSVVRALKLDSVKKFISDLWDIAENDLDISGSTIRQLIVDCFDGIIAELRKDYDEGGRDAQAIALLDFSYSVSNLKSFVLDEMQIPTVGKQLLLNAITELWEQHNIEKTLSDIEQVFNAGNEIIEPLTKVAQCIISQLEVSPSVGADHVDATEPETVMAWYASWVSAKNVRYSSDETQAVNIYQNPELKYFTYKNISKEKMELIAFHSAWITPVLETIPHFASLEKGDYWSNITNIVINGIDATLIGWPKINLPKWVHWMTVPTLTAVAGTESHEGRSLNPFGNDPYVWINILGDWGEVYTYRRISWTARETLLSVLTLLNHDKEITPETPLDNDAWKRRNNNCFEGTCYFYGELMSMVLPAILSSTDKKNYGFIGGGPAAQFWYCGLGGMAMTWAGEYLFGGLTAAALSGEKFDNDLRFALLPLRGRCTKGLFWSDLWGGSAELQEGLLGIFGLLGRLADNILNLYFFTNGNTNGGKYCLDNNGDEREIMGFPAIEDSTYKLPWEKDKTFQCVQNPMGIWSHYPEFNQTYAYDFSHGEGEPVICSRSGIIHRAEDTKVDHNPDDWNNVYIVHIMEIPPGAAVPDNLIRSADIYSPYGGTRAFTDPAPTVPTLFKYDDTDEDIPADVVFPAYPDGLTPTPRPSAARPIGTSFAFLDIKQDRAIPGKTFSDRPDEVFAPDITDGNYATSPSYPLGVTFLPPSGAVGFVPMLATACTYGHGLQDFIGRVFPSRLSRPNKTTPWLAADIEGEFIQQGEQIMEAGDTGISAYNHLHTHVTGYYSNDFFPNALLTIPFLFEEIGEPNAMDFYTSTNE